MEVSKHVAVQKSPSNKGKLVGQKPPLRLKKIWAIRIPSTGSRIARHELRDPFYWIGALRRRRCQARGGGCVTCAC
jgi:hypothetical protein